MDFIASYLSQHEYLTEEEIKLFVKHSYIKSWAAGETIHKIGNTQHHPGLLLSGLVCCKHLSKEGIDKTPSEIGMQAIEDSLIIHFHDDELNKLNLKYPGLMRFKIQFMEMSIRELYKRVMFFSTLTPEERYAELLEKKPRLLDRVQQKYLASYIGVTEVSISRIKKRFKK